jgi:asparagine synthase (glutamine-hydrolysing)
MCGIAGYWKLSDIGGAPDEGLLRRMTDTLRRRGPDDEGYFVDERAGIHIGHRRLAIIDLSQAGHQPMLSACGRWVLAYNGEIYNHLDLRAQLGGRQWRGGSDTETLLAAVSAWGLQGALERSVGQFAIALWDRHAETLSLARDRFGEKPLYVGWAGDCLLWASDLDAFRASQQFSCKIDHEALYDMIRAGYVRAPRSIHRAANKLLPGTLVTLKRTQAVALSRRGDFLAEARRHYWRLGDVIAAQHDVPVRPDATVLEELDRRLQEAIAGQRLAADVPLGAFLSGGVDSSLITALMQTQSDRPVQTFTIGFEDRRYDESPYAAEVARHLGTEHHVMSFSEADLLACVNEMPVAWSEPFADSSQLPTLLLAGVARKRVTVALSGDGGDELFGGYNRYLWGERIWQNAQRMPNAMRRPFGGLLVKAGQHAGRSKSGKQNLLARMSGVPQFADKLDKLGLALRASTPQEFYGELTALWPAGEVPVLDARECAPHWHPLLKHRTLSEQMMAHDTVDYLPDDILVKVDRATMYHSLESRAPFLDHRLAEFAWSLPLNQRIRDGQGKWALRQLLYRHVPREMIERPKQGFAAPLDRWLRGPLRAWASDLLDPVLLRREGYFDADAVACALREHVDGVRNHHLRLWPVLMFQAWSRRIGIRREPPADGMRDTPSVPQFAEGGSRAFQP